MRTSARNKTQINQMKRYLDGSSQIFTIFLDVESDRVLRSITKTSEISNEIFKNLRNSRKLTKAHENSRKFTIVHENKRNSRISRKLTKFTKHSPGLP